MPFETSAQPRQTRARSLSASAAILAVATGLGWGAANAEDTIQLADATAVSGVTIEAKKAIYVDRLPSAEDAPQAVHVIDPKMLDQQAVTTLDQAVRNVPGITANVGEGGGAVAGDQFRIRGFDAANDISSDGLRDFGVYTRDAFNVESVQVFLGPSGQSFGRGSFGGAINTSSKVARLGDSTSAEVTAGTGNLLRGTVDLNREIAPRTAVRLNLMGHQSELTDIDGAESNRWGAAASIGFGLGGPLSATISYLHQSDNRVPYYGVPVTIPTGQTVARPLPVDRSTFYGTERDRDDTNADVLTTRISWQVNDNLKLSNDTRIGFFDRDFMAVAPSCSGACITNFFDNDPATVPMVTRGGGSGPYRLDQWGAQNITTATLDYNLFGLKHQFIGGADFTYESAERANTGSHLGGTLRPTANAYNPDPAWPNAVFSPTTTRETESTNFALFGSEQVWLTDALSVIAGLRVDRYHIESDLITFGLIGSSTVNPPALNVYQALPTPTRTQDKLSDDLFSPRVSVVWQPGENQIYYASWARSAQPATGTASAGVGTPVAAAQTVLDPTEAETFEIGARRPLIGDLNGGVSVFFTKKSNSKELDPNGSVLASGDQQEVRGVELSLDGEILENWSIQASYTFLDTETVFSPINCGTTGAPACGALPASTPVSNPLAIGKEIPFAAKNAATLWTTYNPIEPLTLGLGARYTDKVWLNTSQTAQAPHYFSIDAMAAYAFVNGVTVQLNATNLTDRDDNYDQVVGGRAAHAPGRAFQVALGYSF